VGDRYPDSYHFSSPFVALSNGYNATRPKADIGLRHVPKGFFTNDIELIRNIMLVFLGLTKGADYGQKLHVLADATDICQWNRYIAAVLYGWICVFNLILYGVLLWRNKMKFLQQKNYWI
jgi:hypothetical protein